MQPNRRSTDGVTLNKVMVTITGLSISTAMGIGAFEYTSNLSSTEQNIARIEESQHELRAGISKISDNIHQLVIQQKVDYATQMNISAKVKQNEIELRKLKDRVYRLSIQIKGQ